MPNPLYDALFAQLSGRTSPLLILPDGTSLSGAAFLQMVARFAHCFARLGLAPGDRVAVQVAKSPQALALYGAAVASGVVLLPLNPAYTVEEAGYFVGNAGARLLLADPSSRDGLAGLATDSGMLLLTLDGAGRGSFADMAANQPAEYTAADRKPDDLAALLYTSGTTGRAKGAMLSHQNLLSNAEVLASVWRFDRNDVLLHALPIFHTHGLFVASNVTLLTGGTMIFLPGFNSPDVLRLMPKATAMMGVPTFYTRLLADPGLTRQAVAHMRLFVSGSAPLLAGTHDSFAHRTGHAILERYGMTETNMNTSNPYDGPRRPGTVGLPLPGIEVVITDPATGVALPQGQAGMIEVRGPNVFRGYWQMPDKTAEDLRPDGFFITGDLGRFDENGYLQIVGRQKDLIISGGFNIYPKELELLLDQAPGVLESAVFGVPHLDFGEAVLALLVPQPGAVPDPEAIMADLSNRIARFKLPKAIIVSSSLPRNAMGKVQRNQLRQTYQHWFRA